MIKGKKLSLTTLVVACTTGLVLLSTCIVMFVHQYTFAKTLTRQYEERLEAEARETTYALLREIDLARSTLDALVQDNAIKVTLQLGVDYQLQERMLFFATKSKGSSYYLRSHDNGRLFAPPNTPIPAQAYLMLDEPAPFKSDIQRMADERFYIAFTQQIDVRSRTLGTAGCLTFFEDMHSLSSDFRGGRVLIEQDGTFYDLATSHYIPSETLKNPHQPSVKQHKHITIDDEEGLLIPMSYDKLYYFASLAPLTASVQASMYTNLLITFLATLLCVIAAIAISKRLSRPLSDLQIFAHQIAQGIPREQAETVTSSVIEVQQVATSIDAMLANLEKAEELTRYQTLFEEVVDAVFICTPTGQMLECNAQTLTQLGCTRLEFLQKTVHDFVSEADINLIRQTFAEFENWSGTADPQARRIEVYVMPEYGAPFHAEIHARPMMYMGERAALGVVRDITDRKDAEIALRKAKQQAEDANRAKSSFLAAMSHEIRTPMHSVLGMVDLIEETNLTTEQKNYLAILRSSGVVLLDLINDILDLSKIEAGHIELERIPFSLEALVERTTSMMNVKAALKGLELTAYISPDVPELVEGDPTKLQQILVNLLSNAVKFTSIGHIQTLITVKDKTQNTVFVEISVQDTGIGIHFDKHDSIFDMFTQADSSTARKFGGTGLGLAITKRLTDNLGGTITVDSRPGKGATFQMRIPFMLPTSEYSEQKPPQNELLKGKHFLLVDDNAVTLHNLGIILSDFGASSTETFSIQEATMELDKYIHASLKIDAICIGSDLPEGDAVTLYDSLSNRFGDVLPPMIILVDPVHNAQHATEERPPLPTTGHPRINKPVLPNKLITTVQNLLSPAPAAKLAPEAPATSMPSRGGRILVAEDSNANRLLLGFYFKGSKFLPEFATDGKEAVEMFTAKQYDAILMDIQMPGMDGYEATKAIRELEKESDSPVPIIALTANAYAEDKERCFAAGCTDYLAKPAKKQDVLGILNKYIQ